MLYNEPFKNNEYFFDPIKGVKVENVMSYDRPYLARDGDAGKISNGEKYLLKQHTEEIPTISGEMSFEMIVPFTIKQVDEDYKVNKDVVDSHTLVIRGASHI